MQSNSFITLECPSCKNIYSLRMDSPATFVCQNCGCHSIKIQGENSNDHRLVRFICAECDTDFYVPKGEVSILGCSKCGKTMLIASTDLKLSRIIELPTADYSQKKDFDKKFRNTNIRIAIPYYEGGDRVDRGAKTWIIPEVVWAITDEHVIPPGFGVCRQMFITKNAKTEGLHRKKTKPFLKDVLQRMMKLFPDEDYYGYFNTDIILPYGLSVKHLVPSEGRDIAFHHRLELMNDDGANFPVRKLEKWVQGVCGKDGFVIRAEVLRRIIHLMPEAILGAPIWDDTFVVWCWDHLGRERVELRYGEIWHVSHELNWTSDEPDARFNAREAERCGIDLQTLYKTNWREQHDLVMEDKKIVPKKVLGIIQPGKIGDIIIVLPIAHWFYERGYQVVWPVASEYLPLFDYVNYVEALDLGIGISRQAYEKSLLMLGGVDKLINLGIGFGRDEEDWINSGLNFNVWKYKEAGVPFEERHNLQINRDFRKEYALWTEVQKEYNLNGNKFALMHDMGSSPDRHFKFERKGIRVTPRDGYTVFDWLGVMERAGHLYCVDSCVANLAEQMGVCVGRRTLKSLKHLLEPTRRAPLTEAKYGEDWEII